MMVVAKVDQTQAERPYVFFLFKGITGIYEAWDDTDVELALRRALRLTVFLPNDVKEALWNAKEKIEKEFFTACNSQGCDFFTTHLVRNRESRNVAYRYLEPYMDEMIRLLDEKDWLEKGAVRPQFNKEKKLRVLE